MKRIFHAAGRFPALIITLCAALAALFPLNATAELITVTDIAGRTVTVNAPVSRIMLADSRVLVALNILHPSEPLKGIAAWDDALTIFAFTTILGWSFYGEKCVQYLFGVKAIKVFRVLWLIALPIGATQSLEFVWLLADTLNAMMAIPNLIALILLSPVVYRLTRDHIRDVNADSIDMANELYQKK